ncbi:galectin-3-binding protein-like [Sitodiplosis mosellana]|uniref:galectin-3-binding protein-like n=1 Tax=Sitodiplosis mosellana TaxID=263140 RepID=UPI002443B04D|nr:galectin-3-binding protein-like [Sitodiplosis mosellana]
MSNRRTPGMDYENKALPVYLEALYMDATTSDVKFIFKLADDQEVSVSAHKGLLAARSDVFHAMFYGEVKEKADVRTVDAAPAAFREFLKFFYLRKVHLTMENVSIVMNLGKKYNVDDCLDACAVLLIDNLTSENACFIYRLAILYEQEDLDELCEEKIIENTEAVFASRSFLDSPKWVLRYILDLDNFSCSEADVFKACMAWVKSASGAETVTKKRVEKHIGDLFYEIRFRSMTIQEFADLTSTFGRVFSNGEHKECIQLIASKDFQPKMFTAEIRQQHVKNYQIIECNRVLEYSTKPYYFDSIEIATFSTSEPIMLVELEFTGLRIFRDNKWRDDLMDHLPTEITITQIPDDKGDTKVLVKQTAHLRCEKSGTVVTLSKPIWARPGNKYEIQLKQSFKDHVLNGHCYNKPFLKSEVKLEPNIIIQFHLDAITKDTKLPISPIIALRFARIVE